MRPLQDSLPLKLLRAREVVMDRFRPHLNRLGVTEQQWRVLRALCEVDEIDAGGLADTICIRMPSLSRILADLSARGLITKRNGDRDKRVRILRVTEAGRLLVSTMAPRSEHEYRLIEAEIGNAEYARLLQTLDDLILRLAPRQLAVR